MEVDFGQEAYGQHFDGFMRHYLTVKTGEIPKVRAVYEAFKTHARRPKVASLRYRGAGGRHPRLRRATTAPWPWAQETDPALADAFQDLRELKVDVAYPFLLELYHDYATGLLAADELPQGRATGRELCIPPCGLRHPHQLAQQDLRDLFARSLKKDRYLESIQATLSVAALLPALSRDDEFERQLKARDLYNFRSRSYWLRRLENHGRKERVSVDEYTIEHIMPQNENLSILWQSDLGEEWERVHEYLAAHIRQLDLDRLQLRIQRPLLSRKT